MKTDYYKQNYMVKLFKILANTNRLKILQTLAANQVKPLNVNELSEQLGINQGTLSTHLTRMRENGIIKAKQSGLNMFYSIKDENAIKLINMIEK
jgi:DNA-binding transcriptional ArsR family regulator